MIIDLEYIDDAVFTKLVEYVVENLESPVLTDRNFSTVDKEISNQTILPFVLLSNINGIETADDLECDTLRGGLFTYQIKVTSNKSQDEAKTIMDVVTRAMKSMGFRATSLPVFMNRDNLYIRSARWQREFNDGDTL